MRVPGGLALLGGLAAPAKASVATPEINGLEAAPLLLRILPKVWLILFTVHDGREVQRLSPAAGIHAVVQKSNAATHLIAQAKALVA
jgi:DNA-binding NarL/FixJ family response regulator